MTADSLGDRMKTYENVSRHHLTRRVPVIVRVDGRAFHTILGARHSPTADHPFNGDFMTAMLYATQATAADMQGFTLGYVQSDEASFLLLDTTTDTTEAHFAYNLQKIVSLAASRMSVTFNRFFSSRSNIPVFDARAFNVPLDDVPNYFLWRQRDWERNSVHMYARHFFSHGQLQGKSIADQHDMLHSVGKNWADLAPTIKSGVILRPHVAWSPEYRMAYRDWQLAMDLDVSLATLIEHPGGQLL